MILAINNKKVINYKIVERGVTGNIFLNFIKEIKQKFIKNNDNKFIFMDNAAIHKTKNINEYIKQKKIDVVYNIPYFSKYNPIENVNSMIRNLLQRNENSNIENIRNIVENFKQSDNVQKFKNIFNHVLKELKNVIKSTQIA